MGIFKDIKSGDDGLGRDGLGVPTAVREGGLSASMFEQVLRLLNNETDSRSSRQYAAKAAFEAVLFFAAAESGDPVDPDTLEVLFCTIWPDL